MKAFRRKLKEKIAKNKNAPPSNGPQTTANGPSDDDVPSRGIDDLKKEYTKADFVGHIPTLKECGHSDRHVLLIKKLRLCCVMFNPEDESPQENIAKEMKRQLLLELVDHISTAKDWFSEQVLIEIIAMVSANLFRALPPTATNTDDGPPLDPEEDDPVLDPAWPRLQIVYEFLLRFVVSQETDSKLMKKYVNPDFVIKVLDLFDSEDPRERDYLKTILHRIYGKFMALRSFIRRAINNVFYNFIYETERHNGVGELLEILGSIINGFALPLKEEHKKFLRNVLIPLHKVKTLALFHQQLAYCVTQFIDKDPTLSTIVLSGLLRFWPMVSSSKEVLFLNELEEVLELTQNDEFQHMMEPLFKQIAASICSPHFQVAERALFLWNNEYIASLTSDHRRAVLPILCPALTKNSKNHWNATVHSLTFNIIKMFMEMDSDLWDKCLRECEQQEREDERKQRTRMEQWAALKQKAQTTLGSGS